MRPIFGAVIALTLVGCWGVQQRALEEQRERLRQQREEASKSDAGAAAPTSPEPAAEQAADSCLPNGAKRSGLASSSECCSGKAHEIFYEPGKQESGTKATVCCGSKDSGSTPECH